MDIKLLNKAYEKLVAKPANIINTRFQGFDNEFTYCNKGSIITFCGTLNMTLFLNFIRNFSIQNKKSICFIEKYQQEHLLKQLIKLNALSHNRNILQSKKEIEKWNISLFDNKYNNIDKFYKIIKNQNPDYIFISDLTKFKIKNTETDDFIVRLKTIIHEYPSIAFIQSGEFMIEELNVDLLSNTLKEISDLIIHSKIDFNAFCKFFFITTISLNYITFSLKYDYKNFKFNEIDINFDNKE